jgi:hypothetical protein
MNRVNLFLIGVNKAGTSWLYYLLDQHPEVFMADAKELYFFGDEGPEEERPASLDDYHAHFPFDDDYRYFGDATVMYYRSPATADEIQAYNPDAKLLAIVRDSASSTRRPLWRRHWTAATRSSFATATTKRRSRPTLTDSGRSSSRS